MLILIAHWSGDCLPNCLGSYLAHCNWLHLQRLVSLSWCSCADILCQAAVRPSHTSQVLSPLGIPFPSYWGSEFSDTRNPENSLHNPLNPEKAGTKLLFHGAALLTQPGIGNDTKRHQQQSFPVTDVYLSQAYIMVLNFIIQERKEGWQYILKTYLGVSIFILEIWGQ